MADEERHSHQEPVVSSLTDRPDPTLGLSVDGKTLVIREWGGPEVGIGIPLHVHHADDEAWQVLQGTLKFRFADREVLAPEGSTVFVPAGVAHTFGNAGPGPARYLMFLTPRLQELIDTLHRTPPEAHQVVYHRFQSEVLA